MLSLSGGQMSHLGIAEAYERDPGLGARLAVLVDYARPADESPVFTHTFVDRFAEILRHEEVPNEFVPYQRILQLRRSAA